MNVSRYSDEGYALIGAAIEVHQKLGGGLAEEIYQESMELELSARRIPFLSKQSVSVTYKETLLRKQYVPDLLLHDAVLDELKAVSKLLAEHEAQLLNYMRITRKPVGYLLNFGPIDKLEWKRFVI